MDNSTDLAVDIVLKGVFTLTSILGVIPNALIIFLFYKTQKEMQSYGIFQISFAITELVCSVAQWLTMNRMYIITTKSYWYVPIGPCNYLGDTVCNYAVTIQSGCILNITMLIPMSFMYRYYVVANGAPQKKKITIILLIFIVPPLIAVPLLVSALNTTGHEKIPLCKHYYCFQYNNQAATAIYVKFYSSIVFLLFFSNFIFAFLILRRLKKHMISLTTKTAKMHKMLTMALIFHSLVHLILVVSSVTFIFVANDVINFPYADVLPTLIYSTIPFLNGMVCLCFVPYYRVLLKRYLYPPSTAIHFLQTQERRY